MRWLDTWIRNDRNWCRAVKADGWDGLIQGAFSGGLASPLYPEMRDHCQAALRNARQEGMRTAAYTNAAPWRTPRFWFEKTIDNIGSELQHLSFIALDHELSEGNRPTDADMEEFIRLLRTLKKPIIGYSADWFVGMRAANGFKTKFALDGYWYARYDNNPFIGVPVWPMAQRIVGKQYTGSTQVHGKTVDKNEFDDVWLAQLTAPPAPPAPPEEDEVPTQAEYNALVAKVAALEKRTVDYVRFQGTNSVYEVTGHTLNAVSGWEEYGDQTEDRIKERKVIMRGTPEYKRYAEEYEVTYHRMPSEKLKQVRPNDD